MSPRLISLLVFIAVFVGVQTYGARRDQPARVPFEIEPPVGFQSFDRGDAVAYVTGFDDESAQKYGPGSAGKVFFHFRADDEPEGPPIVVETDESQYPLRAQDSDRDALFQRPGMTKSGVYLTLRDSSVARLGQNEVIVAHYDAMVGDKAAVVSMYGVPTDRGMALVNAFCPKADEAKYQPLYDQMITNAKGVTFRPARLSWYLVGALAAIAAAAAYAIAMRLSKANREPKPQGTASEAEKG